MLNLGTVRPGTTIYIPWDTFAGATGASITSTGLATADIEVYKDGSMTQRGSDNGYTLLDTDGIDLDGITGIQGISINLADNSTAGFYAGGSSYWVVISSVTIDGQTVNFIAAYFTIGYESAVLNTSIATLSSQTSFTLTNGPAEDDALNGMVCVIHDVASAVQLGQAFVLDYTGSTKTVTLQAGTTFTAAASDNIAFWPRMDLGYVAGSVISTSSAQLGVNVVNAAGTAWNSGAIGAATLASDTIAAAKIATGAITAAKFAVGAIDAAAIATDAVAEIADGVWDEARSGHTAAGTYGEASMATVLATGTADAGSTSNTLVDASRAEASTTAWVNSWLVMLSGDNLGEARRIDAFAPSTDTITVAQAFGATIGVGDVYAIVPAAYVMVHGFQSSAISAAAIAANAIGAAELAADAVAEIADAIWDEARTDHTAAGTYGQATQATFMGAVASATSSTLVLGTQSYGSAASASDDFYNGLIVLVIAGLGEGQQRTITDYVGSSKTITPDGNWTTTPDATSKVVILGV